MKKSTADLNLLHLFYLVIRHGGIAAAQRQLPHPIQPAGVRARLRRLEEATGTKLFARNPVRPLRAGWTLYDHIRGGMETLLRQLAGLENAAGQLLRIGSDPALVECHLQPAIASWTRTKSDTRIQLINDEPAALQRALEEGRLDLVITFQTPSLPKGLASQRLGSVPLVLLVPAGTGISSAECFWSGDTIVEHLIAPTPGHPIAEAFEKGLGLGGFTWPPRITLPSAVPVAPLVAARAGAGVVPDFEHLTRHPTVRALPLAGFEPVTVVCLWRPPDTRRLQPVLRHLETHAEAGNPSHATPANDESG